MVEEIKQWEYRVQMVGGFFSGVKAEELSELLNEWGEDGWEVVSTHIIENANKRDEEGSAVGTHAGTATLVDDQPAGDSEDYALVRRDLILKVQDVEKQIAYAEVYSPPPGYNDMSDHLNNFFNSVRTRKPVTENEVFGNYAAIGCHLSNASYFSRQPALWDAAAKKITT